MFALFTNATIAHTLSKIAALTALTHWQTTVPKNICTQSLTDRWTKENIYRKLMNTARFPFPICHLPDLNFAMAQVLRSAVTTVINRYVNICLWRICKYSFLCIRNRHKLYNRHYCAAVELLFVQKPFQLYLLFLVCLVSLFHAINAIRLPYANASKSISIWLYGKLYFNDLRIVFLWLALRIHFCERKERRTIYVCRTF